MVLRPRQRTPGEAGRPRSRLRQAGASRARESTPANPWQSGPPANGETRGRDPTGATASPVPIGGRRKGVGQGRAVRPGPRAPRRPGSISPGAEYEAPGFRAHGERAQAQRPLPGSRGAPRTPQPGAEATPGEFHPGPRRPEPPARTRNPPAAAAGGHHSTASHPAGRSRAPPGTGRRARAPSWLPIQVLHRSPSQGVTVSETASSSPRNSSPWWKNQLRFAGSRSPPFSISPSRWMYSPSFADSSW